MGGFFSLWFFFNSQWQFWHQRCSTSWDINHDSMLLITLHSGMKRWNKHAHKCGPRWIEAWEAWQMVAAPVTWQMMRMICYWIKDQDSAGTLSAIETPLFLSMSIHHMRCHIDYPNCECLLRRSIKTWTELSISFLPKTHTVPSPSLASILSVHEMSHQRQQTGKNVTPLLIFKSSPGKTPTVYPSIRSPNRLSYVGLQRCWNYLLYIEIFALYILLYGGCQ